jgi:hypothetical protein
MATRLYGVLLDGLKKPIINATVVLLAKGNTITVLNGSEAIFKTDAQGAYNVTVQSGYYKVIIGAQGIEPYKAGEIAIYADSPEGSLNSYLVNWAEEDLTPEVIKQVKELVAVSEEYALQAGRSASAAQSDATDARNSKASAAQSASDALVYKNDSKANADAAKQAQAGAAGSANTANTALTTIQGIQKDVTASKDRAVTAETNAKSSENVATQAKTDAVTAKDQAVAAKDKAQQIADSIDPQSIKHSIGLGSSPRDCPDISGNPSGYVGFMRIMANAKGFPSIASGESSLTGYISQVDGTPAYTGVFQGWATRSLYTYRWSPTIGPQWTRHARKNEVDRLDQLNSETWLYNHDKSMRLGLTASSWGCYSDTQKKWIPLDVSHGGTGAATIDGARTNLGLGRDNSPQLNSLFLDRTSDSTGAYTTGGMLHTRLLANDNTVRLAADMYVQTFPNEQGRLTIRFTYGGSAGATKYLDFTSEGNLIVDSAILKSTVEKPLQINSANPAIRFNETDRPANTPTYTLIANGGNWFIHKSDYDDAGSTSTAISYNFANDRLDVQNLKASGFIATGSGISTITGQDWNAQHTDNIQKFKPISGGANGPAGSMNLGGIHVQFSKNYAVQFGGRNSGFWGRTIEAGTIQEWKKLLTVDDLNSSTDLAVRSLTTSNPVKSGGGRIDVLGSTSDYSKMDCFVRGFDSTGNSLAWALGSSVGVSKMLSLKNFFSGAEILLNGNDGAVQLKTGAVGGAAAQAITINKDEVYSTVNFSITKEGKRFSIENSANSELSFNMRVWGSSTRQNVFEVGTSAAYLFYAQKTSQGQLFDVNGNINCVTLNQSSDRRLKENINVIADATGAIRKINGYTYTLKDGGSNKAGVIAQEVMEALPEAVGSFIRYGEELPGPTEDGNRLREEEPYLNVDYSALTGLLVQFARESDDRITKLETEVEELKKLVATLVNKEQPLP